MRRPTALDGAVSSSPAHDLVDRLSDDLQSLSVLAHTPRNRDAHVGRGKAARLDQEASNLLLAPASAEAIKAGTLS